MGDQVEEWKRSARRQMARSLPSRGARPQMSIRVTAGFLLLCATAGVRLRPWGPLFTLAALSSMVLVHEFARALAVRAFGGGSKTAISALGVSNEYSGSPPRGPAALATEIAGALANLLCASGCLWALRVGVRGDAAVLLQMLAMSHAFWGAAQVLPLLPFRAGRALASHWRLPERFAHAGGSIAFALVAAAVADALHAPLLLPVLTLAALSCAAALGTLTLERWDERSGASGLALQAEAQLSDGDPSEAAELAQRALATARSTNLRQMLWSTLAWAAMGTRDPLLAHGAIARLPAELIDFYLIAAYLSCCNRLDEAEQLLREAREHGLRDRETSKLLIELALRRGNPVAALALARDDARLLSADDWRVIEEAIPNARSIRSA